MSPSPESPRRQLRNLAEDFYLNLVDWSSTNVLGVGLASCVYLWTAHNATLRFLGLKGARSTLAVGTIPGRLHVYDANRLTLQRTYQQAHTRIGAIARNAHVLFSGSRDRYRHRDVREVTSRPFKRGGNDNTVCIWGLQGSRRSNNTGGGAARNAGPTPGAASGSGAGGDAPLWKFHEHTAAVKALAWDPHVSGVLATGGGTQDKHIRFWNTISGVQSDMVADLARGRLDPRLFVHHRAKQICIQKSPMLNMVARRTTHCLRLRRDVANGLPPPRGPAPGGGSTLSTQQQCLLRRAATAAAILPPCVATTAPPWRAFHTHIAFHSC
ncbi:hypothetical protein B0H11DRAFT_2376928 [Mycena galericulata]|nr:hypothetical protein B0H11DRAFT_2376928 [Mycena galericulata]